MKRAYYLFNPGRMSRKDHTLRFTARTEEGEQKPRYLPIRDVSALYMFGSVDANSALYNYLGQQHIPVHFFDYHKHYTGSFSPREHLLAGQNVDCSNGCLPDEKTSPSHCQGTGGGSHVQYVTEPSVLPESRQGAIRSYRAHHSYTAVHPNGWEISELMGVEGNCRQIYYDAFPPYRTWLCLGGGGKNGRRPMSLTR